MTTMLYRQGDILLEKVAAPPKDRGGWNAPKPVEGGVIAFGEATGHAHRVVDGEVFDQGGIRYVAAGPEGTRLVHDEHDTIVLPEGTYRVIRQREFGDGDTERTVSD